MAFWHPIDGRLLARLEALVGHERAALRGFELALAQLATDTTAYRALAPLRDEHAARIEALSRALHRWGGAAAARARGPGRGLVSRLHALRGQSGAIGALRELSTHELAMQTEYTELLSHGHVPVELATLLRQCRDAERLHVAVIFDVLAGLVAAPARRAAH